MCRILPRSPSEILKSAVSSFFYLAGLWIDPTDTPSKIAWRGPLHEAGSQFLVQLVLALSVFCCSCCLTGQKGDTAVNLSSAHSLAIDSPCQIIRCLECAASYPTASIPWSCTFKEMSVHDQPLVSCHEFPWVVYKLLMRWDLHWSHQRLCRLGPHDGVICGHLPSWSALLVHHLISTLECLEDGSIYQGFHHNFGSVEISQIT